MTSTKKKPAPETAKPAKKQKRYKYEATPWSTRAGEIERRLFVGTDIVAAQIRFQGDGWSFFVKAAPDGTPFVRESETREMAMEAADCQLKVFAVKHDDVRSTPRIGPPTPLSGWMNADGDVAMQRRYRTRSGGSRVAAEVTRDATNERVPWRWTIRTVEGRRVWIAREATQTEAMAQADTALLGRFRDLFEGPMPCPVTTRKNDLNDKVRSSPARAGGGIVSAWIPKDDSESQWDRFYERSECPAAATVKRNAVGNVRWVCEIRDPNGRTVQFDYGTTAEEARAAADELLLTKFSEFHDGFVHDDDTGGVVVVQSPPPQPRQRAAVVAMPWVFNRFTTSNWSRELAVPIQTGPMCAYVHATEEKEPALDARFVWRAFNPLTAQVDSGTARTLLGAAAAANAALTTFEIEHDGLLPGQTIVKG